MEVVTAQHGRGSGASERESPQEDAMKLVATAVAAFALAAFATPALACGDKATHAETTKSKDTVAKKAAKTTKGEQRPATAQN